MLARIGALAFSGLAAVLGACGDPCVDLSETICKCEPTELEQQACLQLVEIESNNVEADDEQRQTCEALLDTCTCKKLANGDLAACGLAHEDA